MLIPAIVDIFFQTKKWCHLLALSARNNLCPFLQCLREKGLEGCSQNTDTMGNPYHNPFFQHSFWKQWFSFLHSSTQLKHCIHFLSVVYTKPQSELAFFCCGDYFLFKSSVVYQSFLIQYGQGQKRCLHTLLEFIVPGVVERPCTIAHGDICHRSRCRSKDTPLIKKLCFFFSGPKN